MNFTYPTYSLSSSLFPVPSWIRHISHFPLSHFSTVHIPSDFQFQVPYTIFTYYECLDPFLDHSAVYPGPLVHPPHPAPPLLEFTPSSDTSFPLALLVQVYGLHHQLTLLQEEEAAEAQDTFPHQDAP